MIHSVHDCPEGIAHRFASPEGTVWVLVHPKGEEAVIDVYEEDAALASRGLDDDEAHALPEMKKARNRFGATAMLAIVRTVRNAMPEIRRWTWERKSGINAGRMYERPGA